jgi:RHS repeat-associated protein
VLWIGDQPLIAESSGNTTFYFYGLGAIGKKTTDWAYSLPDGANTPRQLSDPTGDITLSARYTPWGDTLETHGTGNFAFGYFGGILDAATGLLYVGNGQYYDPATGRFLTRDAKPDSSNPYVPWDPTGALLGPLGLLALVYGRKKKGSKAGMLLVLLLVGASVGMTLAACGPGEENGGGNPPTVPDEPPTVPPGTPAPGGPETDPGSTPSPSETPTPILEIPECPTAPTGTPVTPTPSPKRFEKVIFICGVGDGTACANGGAPLNPFRRWAERNGYGIGDFSIYDVDVCGGKLPCANKAQADVDANNSSRFLLIGHSAGADAVIVAGDRVADKARIAGIVLLDPTLTATLENDTPPDYTDLQSMADNLPKPKFLGDTPNDGIIVDINGAIREPYSFQHNQLALEDEVVTDMINDFGWSEMK